MKILTAHAQVHEPVRLALSSLVLLRFAPVRSALVRFACFKAAPLNSDSVRLARTKVAPVKVAPVKFAPVKFAPFEIRANESTKLDLSASHQMTSLPASQLVS